MLIWLLAIAGGLIGYDRYIGKKKAEEKKVIKKEEEILKEEIPIVNNTCIDDCLKKIGINKQKKSKSQNETININKAETICKNRCNNINKNKEKVTQAKTFKKVPKENKNKYRIQTSSSESGMF